MKRTRIRWWLVGLFIGLGAVVIAIGALVSYSNAETNADTSDFWSGLWVNIGTSLLLAAALVAFERAIVKNVREQNKRDIDQAVDRAADDAARRAAEAILPRLEELDERLRARNEAERAERIATAERLSEAPSYEELIQAMRDAADINSLYHPRVLSGHRWHEGDDSSIGVPSAEPIGSPVVTFRYRPASANNSWGEDYEAIFLEYQGASAVQIEWTPDLDPAGAMAALQSEMVRNGEAAATHLMSAGRVFTNLSAALIAAHQGRTAAPDAWLSTNPVIEMVTEDCYITEAGIEVSGSAVALPRSMFRTPIGMNEGDPDPFAAPEGVDGETWQAALDRARVYF